MGQCFAAKFFETDYASFLAWRDWDIPDATCKIALPWGRSRARMGHSCLASWATIPRMRHIYFPCGMTDPQSVDGTSVNLEASLWREVAEETGLTSAELTAEPYWHTVFQGSRIGHIRILHARENADALRARILANLALENQPEFADIYIVRGRADFHPELRLSRHF